MHLQPRIIKLLSMAMQGPDFPKGERVAASCQWLEDRVDQPALPARTPSRRLPAAR